MRKAVISIAAVLCLLALHGCKVKPLNEQEKLSNFQKAISDVYKDYDKEAASRLLKEAEYIIGSAEFKKISNTAEEALYIDCIVCLTHINGTKYFALFCNFTDRLVLLRIRKDDYIGGEVIWRRPEEGCLLSEAYIWRNYCVAVLEQKAGHTKFSFSYSLEMTDSGGNWVLLADVKRNDSYWLGNDKRKVYYSLPEGLILQPGHYRMIIPVTYTPSDEMEWKLKLNLSCEFNVD